MKTKKAAKRVRRARATLKTLPPANWQKVLGQKYLDEEYEFKLRGKDRSWETASGIWSVMFHLSDLAQSKYVPLSPICERIRQLIQEKVRVWTVHAGDDLESDTGKMYPYADAIGDELEALTKQLGWEPRPGIGELVTLALCAAEEADEHRGGTLNDDGPRTAANLLVEAVLRIGGFGGRDGLRDFFYTTTPKTRPKAAA